MTNDRTELTQSKTESDVIWEPEVEGHLNPALATELVGARQQDLHERVDRDREARSAARKTHDGGILVKVRRFARRLA